MGYTNAWKEELIENAIEKAVSLCHNFDPYRVNKEGIMTKNPFAYVTAICDNAIKEQIKKEKKHLYIRYKSMDMCDGLSASLLYTSPIPRDS